MRFWVDFMPPSELTHTTFFYEHIVISFHKNTNLNSMKLKSVLRINNIIENK